MAEKPIILVVDDDQPILLLMRNLLNEFGFEPVSAGSGRAALDEARRRTPDLILLDKNMPGMTGEEVIRELRAEPELGDVPVLILSGEPLEPAELADLGANGAVLKPFDLGALIQTIRAHIN